MSADADDLLRRTVLDLSARKDCAWAGIYFVEDDRLVFVAVQVDADHDACNQHDDDALDQLLLHRPFDLLQLGQRL